MGFKMLNEEFVCENCSKQIIKHPEGSARNHCPFCLYSKHLDKDFPGDRSSDCGGLMQPIGIDNKKNKGWMIKHRCLKCGKEILNKVAPDDNFLEFIQKINKNTI
ncbi:MAG: RNHCP domain-containing protein [Candidatus Gracilibacteria bacterium]|nr:RNHCP domain-containing protein [Candidatus Gracilibacteria bacterium]